MMKAEEQHVSNQRAVSLQVHAELEYSVFFTHDALALTNTTLIHSLPLATQRGPLVFVDSGLDQAWPTLRERIRAYLEHFGRPLARPPIVVPGGEQCKNGWDEVHHIIAHIRRQRLCRHSGVIVLGGGAVLDVVGLGTALVHRGVRLIRMPTTTLSQGDSGVGVKNGINLQGVKNLLGTFTAPHAVINDFDFLKTLDRNLVLDGVAEAFKVALIKDAKFFYELRRTAADLGDGASAQLQRVIRQSCLLHLDHIRDSGDPFELGEARPLDFGHWVAHWLEGASNYAIRHGEGVALGIALDVVLSTQRGFLTLAERDMIHHTLEEAGLPTWHPLLKSLDRDNRPRVLEGLAEFREHLGGRLSLTLPCGIGSRVEIHHLEAADVVEAIAHLENRKKRKGGSRCVSAL